MQVVEKNNFEKNKSSVKNNAIQFLFKYGAIALLVFIIFYFSTISDAFFTYDNFTDILRSISIVTLLALGVTFTLVVGGFDLSVGSTMSFSTVVSASLMVWYEMPLWLVLILPLLIGVLVGVFNSFLIVIIGIPDLLATLSVMYIVAGLHRTYTEGYSVYNNMPLTSGGTAPGQLSDAFLLIGQGQLMGLPVPVWIMLVMVIASYIVLHHTRWGRILYMTGGNAEAATLSGVNVKKVKFTAYVVSGFFASMAGILFTARVGSGQIDAGAPLMMEAVAAVFVGYSVLGAGKPNALGTFFGAAVIGILLNGLTILNLPYYAFDIIKGSVLVAALAVTYIYAKKKLNRT
ncbi:ribose ABC transport system, permease protein RbsC [Planococcus halocryophilus Or1]|uniref:Sugar ABC transporter permease n=1 Tax=Planococcus halocryophilus TaxID=1215089 RepID=A0A1C7DT64_9BACL|nr:ABC transporter permease [Planococcus halocryophilus]ANU14528.1 sugar ABC transporter permease [Planococcus halocryophilus]EMF48171.1 ribose ABC transport system, permease protein RbsC [Planococcus halocryophilus Or1]